MAAKGDHNVPFGASQSFLALRGAWTCHLSPVLRTTDSITSSIPFLLLFMVCELIDPEKFGQRFLRTPATDCLYTGQPPFADFRETAVIVKVPDGVRPERPAGHPTISNALNPPIDHFPKYCVNALLKAPLPLNLAPPEGGLWLTFAILQTDLPLGFTTCIPRSSTQPSCGSVFTLGFSNPPDGFPAPLLLFPPLPSAQLAEIVAHITEADEGWFMGLLRCTLAAAPALREIFALSRAKLWKPWTISLPSLVPPHVSVQCRVDLNLDDEPDDEPDEPGPSFGDVVTSIEQGMSSNKARYLVKISTHGSCRGKTGPRSTVHSGIKSSIYHLSHPSGRTKTPRIE
ncbi:hypothetical protein B0H13DRAFT_2288095 [Mycena leptocephala]|nr:hypothetical protein B0H13DRAFT_2288095 [Mycena leptocephala]